MTSSYVYRVSSSQITQIKTMFAFLFVLHWFDLDKPVPLISPLAGLCLYPSFFCLRCLGRVTLGAPVLSGRLFTVLELPCDAVAEKGIRNHV